MKKRFNITQLLDINFEKLEQEIFEYICEIGRCLTIEMLQQLDEYLMKYRNKKRYKAKQIRKTTVKTVYGEVEYSRRMYYDNEKSEYIYLLDDKLQIERIGTISANLSKKIAEACINMPFRKAAETISSNTGQSISYHGIWNVVQQVGNIIQADEEILLNEMKAENTRGDIESKIIFMEADGVYINIQKDRKKAKSQEIKLSTIYTGWYNNGSSLSDKKVFAGMETSKTFNQKTEALIQSVYDTDATQLRVVNGDGASWIKNTYEPNQIFQLDRFHIKKEIKRCILDKNIQHIVLNHFSNKKMDDMLDTIETYINSLDDGKKNKEIKLANNLYSYLSNNYDGLLPWQDQVEKIPDAPEGVTYKNMGVQENQNCSLVCMRMKGRKMRWSVDGANNLVKIIYRNANGDLDELIENNKNKINVPINIDYDYVLSSSGVKERVGKGSKYFELFNSSLPALNYNTTATSKILNNIKNV